MTGMRGASAPEGPLFPVDGSARGRIGFEGLLVLAVLTAA